MIGKIDDEVRLWLREGYKVGKEERWPDELLARPVTTGGSMTDNASGARTSTKSLIMTPVIITLAITVLRLEGELHRWPTLLFNREAGGGAGIIGITWLVFLFGVYFAIKLARTGNGPASAGRAIGYSVLGLLVAGGGIALNIPGGKLNFPGKEPIGWLLVAAGALVPLLRGWTSLAKVLLVYGYAARLPVLLIMFYSIRNNWDTHYSLGPPGIEFPDLWTKFVEIALLPQMIFWIAFTVIVGSLVGSIAAAITRKGKSAGQAASP